jgi:tetratricopeptide (TPR) repeat protein/predicted Ser/Thr protein kinase
MQTPPPGAGPDLAALRLLTRVVEASPSERAHLIEEACREHPEVRHAFDGLWRAHESTLRFDPPGVEQVARWLLPAEQGDLCGTVLGSCRLLRRLGEGGMGHVYEAYQDPPGRQVAVKLLRTALPDESARRRFETEARAMAAIDHPGVCRVYEAGTWSAPSGGHVPYFAMELVREAVSITSYATSRRLGVPERVELIGKACDAVLAIHGKGVLHRDLKPSNILVGTEGRPIVIDFGVARRDETATLLTHAGTWLGTPAYMAPEQVLGHAEDVDVRTDVHALGVILYELLSGRLPRPVADGSVAEIVEAFRTRPPLPIDKAAPGLPGDLAAVVHKAIDPDPARRYGTPGEFAADLRRWRDGLAVVARPPTPLRAAVLWTRRHRALAVMGGLFVVATAVGLLGTTRAAQDARAAQRVAEEERARAEDLLTRTREFVPWLLSVHERGVAGLPRGLPVARGLVLGVRRHLEALVDGMPRDVRILQAAQRARVLLAEVEGNTSIYGVGLPEEAREDARAALQLGERALARVPDADVTRWQARAHLVLGRLAAEEGSMPPARAHVEKAAALAAQARSLDPTHAAEHLDLDLKIGAMDAGVAELEGNRARMAEVAERTLQHLERGRAEGLVVSAAQQAEVLYRAARAAILTGASDRLPAWLDELQATFDVEPRSPGDVAALSSHYKWLVYLADAAELAASPLPYLERAAEAFDRWHAQVPEDREVMREGVALGWRVGVALLEGGRPEAARGHLERALREAGQVLAIDPADGVTWLNLVTIRLALSRTLDALHGPGGGTLEHAAATEAVQRLAEHLPDGQDLALAQAHLAMDVARRLAAEAADTSASASPVGREAAIRRALQEARDAFGRARARGYPPSLANHGITAADRMEEDLVGSEPP